jgi:hypothetical protein
LKNSDAATSSPSAMSLPGVKPAAVMASISRSSAARLLDRLGGESALVAETGGESLRVQDRLERVVRLDAPAQALAEGLRADRQDHELLDVDVRVGVRSAVDDVQHRNGENVRVGTTDVAVERHVCGVRCGTGDREAHAEDRVGAELLLVVGTVEPDELGVDRALFGGVEAFDGRAEHVDDGVDCLLDALAEVAALVAVAQFVCLEGTGGCTGGHRGARHRAVFEQNLDLNGRVSSGVKNFAGAYCLDQSHGWFSLKVVDCPLGILLAPALLPSAASAVYQTVSQR